MFDTMTLTKVVGSCCGALLAFMLGGWAADLVYHGAGGHGEERAQSYVIDTGAEAAPAEEAPAEDFGAAFAAADPAAGERVFAKCSACHKLDGTDGVGPHLNGVVDRAKASVAGYGYSDALMAMAGDTWTPENLSAFLQNPKGYAPGTKMSFNGLPRLDERANLIAYLKSVP